MKLPPALAIVTLIAACGCGGSGGSGGGTVNQQVRVAVNLGWGGQTGTISAPQSAQSAVMWISWQDPISPFPTVTFNKSSSRGAYNQTVELTSTAPSAPWSGLNVYFYAQPNGQGPIIAGASAQGTITSQGVFLGQNGQPLGPVTTVPAQPAPVVYASFDTVNVGQSVQMQFWMKDQFGQVTAKNPPGGVWSIAPPLYGMSPNSATITPGGLLTGVSPGGVGITVAYHGQTSTDDINIVAP